jgi:hypothetical protein
VGEQKLLMRRQPGAAQVAIERSRDTAALDELVVPEREAQHVAQPGEVSRVEISAGDARGDDVFEIASQHNAKRAALARGYFKREARGSAQLVHVIGVGHRFGDVPPLEWDKPTVFDKRGGESQSVAEREGVHSVEQANTGRIEADGEQTRLDLIAARIVDHQLSRHRGEQGAAHGLGVGESGLGDRTERRVDREFQIARRPSIGGPSVFAVHLRNVEDIDV